MCYDEGTLQAYLDDAYEGDCQLLRQHLSTCAACRQTYDRLKFQDLRMASLLDEAFSDEAFSVEPLHRLMTDSVDTPSPPTTFSRRIQNMHASTKKWIAAAACVSVIASVFTFQPAMAESFLKLFRVNQIESVAISDKDLQDLERAFNQKNGEFNLKDLIKVDVRTNGEMIDMNDPSTEALTTKLPTLKPFGQDLLKITNAHKEPAHDVVMTLDVPKINDVLVSLGETVKLPESLHQKPVVMHFKDAYILNLSQKSIATDGSSQNTYASLAQSTFPEIEIPDQIDQDAFLKSIYAMNFLPENLKQQFMSLDNPGSSIPVPYSAEHQTKEDLDVNGIKVMMIKDKSGDSTSYYYSKDNTLFVLSTNAKQELALTWIKELQ